jgi:hypothetical protein
MYFGGHYNSGGIDTTVTLKFQNTKAVVILFPRYITEISCYRNPLMSDLSVQFDNKQYPPNPANTLFVEFLKANLQCAGWTDFFPALEEGEVSQTIAPPQTYNVRGRNNFDDTMWFWIIPLQRRTCNNFLFEGLNKQSVSVKLTGKFIGTQDKFGKTTRCMDNLWLLNEEDREPNKPDPEFKGTGTAPTIPAEYNLTPPMIFVVRNCYFKLDINTGLTYITNRTWRKILPQDYPLFAR